MCKINHGAIILADIPYSDYNPHQHHGKHYYIVVSNQQSCNFSPVVQAIPASSNIQRRLPVQIEISADCFPRRSFALAEQLTLLPKNLLEKGKFCGTLKNSEMKKLQNAIKLQLSLD
ncbi:MAG: type II toxin-antitoxin system PemK/MazF family toxin [Clostridia bacterium]|nr:type II toxin-antitoxin system PemK/MazF family toxin [Clostridia bacterium]